MSDDGTLFPAIYRGITGGRGPTERKTVPGIVADLERRYGTTPPPGLKEHTWRRMRKNPKRRAAASTIDALRAAQRRARLSDAREARLRRADTITVVADITVSQKKIPGRRMVIGPHWLSAPRGYGTPTDGLIARLIDAWLAREDDQLADMFADAVADAIGQDVLFENVKDWTIG